MFAVQSSSIRIFLTSGRIFLTTGVCIWSAFLGRAQEIIPGSGPSGLPALVNGDLAVLETAEPRKDLNCTVTPEKLTLGFDLKFHAGFSVTLPLKELDGGGNMLSIVFRVTSKGSSEPVYFGQHFRVPPINEVSGMAALDGSFELGEGDYHVDWLMRDFTGRYCSSYWDMSAVLAQKDKQLTVAVPAQSVWANQNEQFQAESADRPMADHPLNVKVLMNFAPQRPEAATLLPQDRSALVSILRSLSRNPRIGKISLVTFNVQQQRVIYRQDFSDQIDFPALGQALKSLNLGTVDVRALGNKNNLQFLATLARNEMPAHQNPAQQNPANQNIDGLIFVGPKSLVDLSIPDEDLKQIAEPEYPVFYMNYTPDPLAAPWRDAIGKMVKFLKGREYSISGPRDFWNAMSEAVEKMAKQKEMRSGAGISGGSDPR